MTTQQALHLAGNAIFFMSVICALVHEGGEFMQIISNRLAKHDTK